MKFKQVTLFGATGLIGGYLLKFLLKDSDIHLINLVGRKPFHLQHDKINNIVIKKVKIKHGIFYVQLTRTKKG